MDLSGTTEIKMKKRAGWIGSWYLTDEGTCLAKTCSMCRVPVLSSEFSRDGRKRFNLSSKCKMCARSYSYSRDNSEVPGTGLTLSALQAREFRTKNKERTAEQVRQAQARLHPDGNKKCYACGVCKGLDHYFRCSVRGDGLQTECKSCNVARVGAEYAREHAEYWEAHDIPLECYVCGDPWRHSDHVIPGNLGGSDEPHNRLPMCVRHNSSKSDIPLVVWLSNKHPDLLVDVTSRVLSYNVWPFTGREALVVDRVSRT